MYLQEICTDNLCNIWGLFKSSGCHSGKQNEEGGGITVFLISTVHHCKKFVYGFSLLVQLQSCNPWSKLLSRYQSVIKEEVCMFAASTSNIWIQQLRYLVCLDCNMTNIRLSHTYWLLWETRLWLLNCWGLESTRTRILCLGKPAERAQVVPCLWKLYHYRLSCCGLWQAKY